MRRTAGVQTPRLSFPLSREAKITFPWQANHTKPAALRAYTRNATVLPFTPLAVKNSQQRLPKRHFHKESRQLGGAAFTKARNVRGLSRSIAVK